MDHQPFWSHIVHPVWSNLKTMGGAHTTEGTKTPDKQKANNVSCKKAKARLCTWCMLEWFHDRNPFCWIAFLVWRCRSVDADLRPWSWLHRRGCKETGEIYRRLCSPTHRRSRVKTALQSLVFLFLSLHWLREPSHFAPNSWATHVDRKFFETLTAPAPPDDSSSEAGLLARVVLISTWRDLQNWRRKEGFNRRDYWRKPKRNSIGRFTEGSLWGSCIVKYCKLNWWQLTKVDQLKAKNAALLKQQKKLDEEIQKHGLQDGTDSVLLSAHWLFNRFCMVHQVFLNWIAQLCHRLHWRSTDSLCVCMFQAKAVGRWVGEKVTEPNKGFLVGWHSRAVCWASKVTPTNNTDWTSYLGDQFPGIPSEHLEHVWSGSWNTSKNHYT